MCIDAKQHLAEQALIEWAQQHRVLMAQRDGLVHDALAAGVSANRIFMLTGIARTTLTRILRRTG